MEEINHNPNEGTVSVADAAQQSRITFHHAMWNIENGYWETKVVEHPWFCSKFGCTKLHTLRVLRVDTQSVLDWQAYISKLPRLNTRANRARTRALCAELKATKNAVA